MAEFDFLNLEGTANQSNLPAKSSTPFKFESEYLQNLDTEQDFNFMGIGEGSKGFQMPTMDVTQAADFKPTWSQQAFGYQDPSSGKSFGGYAQPAINLASAAMSTWLGLKQLGVAEDQLDFDKESFSKQFEAQRTLTNAELESRQKRASDRNVANKDLYSARV